MWYIFHMKKKCTNSKQLLVRWNLIVDACNSIKDCYNFAPNRRKKKNNNLYISYILTYIQTWLLPLLETHTLRRRSLHLPRSWSILPNIAWLQVPLHCCCYILPTRSMVQFLPSNSVSPLNPSFFPENLGAPSPFEALPLLLILRTSTGIQHGMESHWHPHGQRGRRQHCLRCLS